jgi:hypothetical protein
MIAQHHEIHAAKLDKILSIPHVAADAAAVHGSSQKKINVNRSRSLPARFLAHLPRIKNRGGVVSARVSRRTAGQHEKRHSRRPRRL